MFHGGSSFRKLSKILFFKIPKTPKIVPKRIQTCFDCNLGQFFRKNFCPVFHGRSSLRKFSKKSKKVSNFLKCPKSFPKVSKRVLNVFLGKLFEKFLPSFPWKVESSKNFKNVKKFAKFQKCPKSFPKVSKRVLIVIWDNFFEKFLPSFPWKVEFSKIFKNFFFKIPKMPKIVPKRIQTCFDCNLGQFFRKIFAQISMEGRVFENFQKKIKKFAKFQKCPKSFPKVSKRVLNLLWVKFFEKFLPSFPWKVESSKNFKKNLKSFKIPKMPKSVAKSIQTCFEHVLGKIF